MNNITQSPSLQSLTITCAARRNNPRAALRQMWKLAYVPVTPTKRVASVPVGNRYKAVMVQYHANGYIVTFNHTCEIAFNLTTAPASIAAAFNIREHVDVLAAMLDFGDTEPLPALVPAGNSETNEF